MKDEPKNEANEPEKEQVEHRGYWGYRKVGAPTPEGCGAGGSGGCACGGCGCAGGCAGGGCAGGGCSGGGCGGGGGGE